MIKKIKALIIEYSYCTFYNSPSLSNEGVIYFPIALSVPSPVSEVLQGEALSFVSPESKELWITDKVGSDDKWTSVLLANTL